MTVYLPIALVVLSNIFYHICSKSTPDSVSPFASLTVTYITAAVVSAVLYFATVRGGNLFSEYRHLNWSAWILGIAIVGLEAGFIYMYKVGWDMSVGQFVASAALAICLIFVGALLYHEKITFSKVAGILICGVGLYFINR